METATPAEETAQRKRGKPFVKGDSRIKAGPGRPARSAAELEQKRLARRAKDRVVADVQAELKSMLGPAVDKLRTLVDSENEQVALAAATRVVEYAAGKPVSRTELLAQVSNMGDEARRPDIAQLQAAARRLLGAAAVVEAVEVER